MGTPQNVPWRSLAPGALPFVGVVETAVDALRLVAAARAGLIPRIVRRLNDNERRSMIKSGAIFIFSVEESGMKRWTDGRMWSPSRIAGNFLVYRECESTRRIVGSGEVSAPQTSQPVTTSWSERRGLYAERPNGLCKKTITIVSNRTDHHIVSYYMEDDVLSGRLQRLAIKDDMANITVSPSMVRETNFRYPPRIEIGLDEREYVRESARDEAELLERGSPGSSVPSTRVIGNETVSPTSSLHRVDIPSHSLHRWTLPSTNNVEQLNPSPSNPTTHSSYIDNQIDDNTLATSSPSSHGQYYQTIHDPHDPFEWVEGLASP